MTGRLARISAEQIAVLYLVAVLAHPFEELLEPDNAMFFILGRATLPYLGSYFIAEIAPWFEDRYAVTFRIGYELIFEPAHFLTAPAYDGSVVYGFALVRHYQILAYALDTPKSATYGAGAQRAVEAEEIFVRLAEYDTVCLEALRELAHDAILPYQQAPVALREGRLYR